MNDQHMFMRVSLVGDRDGQESNKDSTVPLCDCSVFQQSGREHMPSLFHGVQCPLRASTLYLPEMSLAWVVAFSARGGEDRMAFSQPQVFCNVNVNPQFRLA